MDVMGQFVTPQNTAIMPTAAQREGERPRSCPNRHPNVAPTKKDGTISPPLKPASSVSAVKMIFQKKAGGDTVPSMARSMTGTPAPM